VVEKDLMGKKVEMVEMLVKEDTLEIILIKKLDNFLRINTRNGIQV
jgi:hypothetical protein